MKGIVRPDWPAPPGVVAISTTREGGFSTGLYASFNLGDHVGDEASTVARNRERLAAGCEGLEAVQWLQQVHGTTVHRLRSPGALPTADACITSEPGVACAVLTADCLPVLLADDDGYQVAALHAGWRGLCAGIIARTVEAFDAAPENLVAWLGPAISQARFEVGAEVREQFLREMPLGREAIESHFRPSPRDGHYLADIAGLARAQLHELGVTRVAGGAFCTFDDPAQYYSYRRDGITGRMATLIYKR